ncbi:hypothetical protein ABPG74_016560 [Tetrahymena malaccensis]
MKQTIKSQSNKNSINSYFDLNINDPDLDYLDEDFFKFLEKNRGLINKFNQNYPSWRNQSNKRSDSQKRFAQIPSKLSKLQNSNNINLPPKLITPSTSTNTSSQNSSVSSAYKRIPSCGNISLNESKSTTFFRKPTKTNLPALQFQQHNKINDENYQDKQEQEAPSKIKTSREELKPQVTCKAWGIYKDEDATFIQGENTYEIREMASITKIMTCLVSLKLAKKFDINVSEIYFSVSKTAININGTTAGLEENQWYTIEDLLYGLMLPSGNDAAICLAENFGCLLYFESIGQSKLFSEIQSVDVREDQYVSDYQRYFLKEMNKISMQFLLRCTQFSNPHGLANKLNKSNCNDLAKLTYKAMKWRLFRKIVQTKTYLSKYKIINDQTQDVTYGTNFWKNTNKLLDQGYLGVKTGITTSAGSCLSSYYSNYIPSLQKSVSFIVIVLGGSKPDDRFDDTQSIVDWYIKTLEEQQRSSKI